MLKKIIPGLPGGCFKNAKKCFGGFGVNISPAWDLFHQTIFPNRLHQTFSPIYIFPQQNFLPDNRENLIFGFSRISKIFEFFDEYFELFWSVFWDSLTPPGQILTKSE